MRSFLITLFHTSISGSATGVLCACRPPAFPYHPTVSSSGTLLNPVLGIKELKQCWTFLFSIAGIGFSLQTGAQAAAMFEPV